MPLFESLPKSCQSGQTRDCAKAGDPGGNRTHDNLIKRPACYTPKYQYFQHNSLIGTPKSTLEIPRLSGGGRNSLPKSCQSGFRQLSRLARGLLNRISTIKHQPQGGGDA